MLMKEQMNIEDLWSEYHKTKSVELRNQLIEYYLGIIKYQARQIAQTLPGSVTEGDLIGSGSIGMADAIRAYDPNRGVKFETYCVIRVRGAMLDEIRANDWAPRLTRFRNARISSMFEKARIKLNRRVTMQDVCDNEGMTWDELSELINSERIVEVDSLQRVWFETDSNKHMDLTNMLVDENQADPSLTTKRNDVLRKVCQGLSQDQRMVIIGYYYEKMTMSEIGKRMNLSESRVSQIHSIIVEYWQSKPELKEYLNEVVN